jgi:hypothetical protein
MVLNQYPCYYSWAFLSFVFSLERFFVYLQVVLGIMSTFVLVVVNIMVIIYSNDALSDVHLAE